MRRIGWKKWAIAVMSGSMLFQVPGCVETAALLTSAASMATAGGVWYLVTRIMND